MIIEILAIMGQIIWIGSYIPQLVKTYKTKSVKGLSIYTWIAFLIGYLTILPILIYSKVYILITGYVICMLMVIIQIIMIRRYNALHN